MLRYVLLLHHLTNTKRATPFMLHLGQVQVDLHLLICLLVSL